MEITDKLVDNKKFIKLKEKGMFTEKIQNQIMNLQNIFI